MKTFCIYLLLSFISLSQVVGQKKNYSLQEDSTFTREIARFIRYPDNARQQQLVAKVYTSFVISDQGKIEQIKILNFSDVIPAFQQAVMDALAELPNRKIIYQGTYLLPISFQLEGENQIKKPTDEDKNLIEKLNKHTLLKEVYVTAYM
ncbi:energy transducer TonB [Spirosoma arboris]|nr:energy transducer TonB [Spirosoma arboris]